MLHDLPPILFIAPTWVLLVAGIVFLSTFGSKSQNRSGKGPRSDPGESAHDEKTAA